MLLVDGQPAVRSPCVAIHARLIGVPGTPSIPTIVEHEHRHGEGPLPRQNAVNTVGDVAGVAMAHQEDTAWTRHRAIPPVEAHAILRRKLYVLALDAQRVPVAAGVAGGDKDEALFEDHGAPDEQQIRYHKATGDPQHAPWPGGGWSAWRGYRMSPSYPSAWWSCWPSAPAHGGRQHGSRDTQPPEHDGGGCNTQ